MAAQIPNVPQRIRLALEQRHDDGAARCEARFGAAEEADEEFLVIPDLAVHVGGLPADVGEVEQDAIHGRFLDRLVLPLLWQHYVLGRDLTVAGRLFHKRAHLGRINVVEELRTRRLNRGDVGFGVGIFLEELGAGLVPHRRRYARAFVVCYEAGGEAEVAFADEEDAVGRGEGDRWWFFRRRWRRLFLLRLLRVVRVGFGLGFLLGLRRVRFCGPRSAEARKLPLLTHFEEVKRRRCRPAEGGEVGALISLEVGPGLDYRRWSQWIQHRPMLSSIVDFSVLHKRVNPTARCTLYSRTTS